MQLEAVKGLYGERHKKQPYHDGKFLIWGEHRTKLTPFHYTDGVTIWLSREDLTPDDDFLGNVRRSSFPQQAPHQQHEADEGAQDTRPDDHEAKRLDPVHSGDQAAEERAEHA